MNIREQIAKIRRGERDAHLGIDEYANTMEAMLFDAKRMRARIKELSEELEKYRPKSDWVK